MKKIEIGQYDPEQLKNGSWKTALENSIKFSQLDVNSFDPGTLLEGKKLLLEIKKEAAELLEIFYQIQVGVCPQGEALERLGHICAVLPELENSSCTSVKIFAAGLGACASWMQPMANTEEFYGVENIERMLLKTLESIRETEKLFKALEELGKSGGEDTV